MVHVIVQAPEGISAVTGHEHVFRLWVEDEIFEGQVRFDETAVLLRFQHPDYRLQRNGTEVEPGRCRVNGSFFGALEDELRDDLLHPSRTRFAPAGDDDVVRAESEVIPSCRVCMMVLELGGFDGPLWAFGSFGRTCHVVGRLLVTGACNGPKL